ncbi:hypothetical protein BC629DRAFT_1715062 [Irpex lacteus]|nr:hypothetical protein BC629DRAFT_1715062 [Irpex lacteus]
MSSNGQHSAEPSDYGRQDRQEQHGSDSLIRRSWHAMSDVLSPFSPSALAQLPKKTADNVPEAEQDEEGHMPTVRDYHAINSVPPQVRVPKKIATPVKVEGKVWFAMSEVSCKTLRDSILLNADQVAKNMAYAYAVISVGTLVNYGYAVYQRRITMIRKRDPGHFDQILGPLVISALLFIAVLTNFIIRGYRRKEIPIPGLDYLPF